MVGFNIENFRSVLNETGIMRPSKFLVRLNLPRGMINTSRYSENKSMLRKMEFLAEATTTPLLGLSTHQAQRYGYGPQTKRPVGVNFTDVPINFIGDKEGKVFQFFYDWLNMIFNFNMSQSIDTATGEVNGSPQLDQSPLVVGVDPYEIAYALEYHTDLEIILFDLTGNAVKSIVLREAYPLMIQNIELNWADSQSYVKIPTVFTFTDYYINPILPSFPDTPGGNTQGLREEIISETAIS